MAGNSTPAKKATPAAAKGNEGREPTADEIKANEEGNPALTPDPDEAATIASVPGASDVHRAEAHLAAQDEVGPADTTPPAYVYLDESAAKGGVKLADVAALQGVQVAPDASTVRTVAVGDLPFVSEGMRNEIEQYGFAIDPMTGRKVVKSA